MIWVLHHILDKLNAAWYDTEAAPMVIFVVILFLDVRVINYNDNDEYNILKISSD